MKKGLLSFAVAFFAILVLFYFASAAVSLSDYQAAGQKRLQLQVLSQEYGDTMQYFDDSILDALVDSGYSSSESGTCSGSVSTFNVVATQKIASYVQKAGENMAETFNSSEWLSEGYTPAALAITSLGSQSVTSACVGGTLSMNRFAVNASFPVNLTSYGRHTGYINSAFNQSYDVFTARSGANYYILVLRGASQLRCINITGCP